MTRQIALAFIGRLNILDLIVVGTTFVTVLCLFLLVGFLVRRHRAAQERKVKERLGLVSPQSTGDTHVLRLWHEGEEITTSVPHNRHRQSMATTLERLCWEAGWSVPWHTVVLGVVGVALLVFVVVFVLSGYIVGGLSGSVGVLIVFWAYLKRRISQRTTLFEKQLLSALQLATRSLRAGHPLTGAFRLISEEINAPVGQVFGEICQQQEMGMSLEEATQTTAAKSNSPDLKLFATSMVIQLRSGGNVADMMDRLSSVIRDRMRLGRHVRVLTAQTQFSKRILAALPLILFGTLNLLNPQYVEPLYSTASGQLLLVIAGAGVLTGMYVMNRMAVLRF